MPAALPRALLAAFGVALSLSLARAARAQPAPAPVPAADAGATPDAGVAPAADAGPPPPAPPAGLTSARLEEVQAALRAKGLDGWLFYDFRGSDPIAARVLGLPETPGSRRWYCLIPARGPPQKLVHAIEPHALDGVPGITTTYSSWRLRDRELGRLLRGLKRIALQHSPRNELPTIARVDGGTLELVRSMGPEIVSSAELVAQLASTLSPEELDSQGRAAQLLAADQEATAQEAARRLRAGNPATERELQDFVLARWAAEGLQADGDRPLVSVDGHTAEPHYEPAASGSAVAGKNSLLLLDFSARLGGGPHAIYGDLTRVYFLGESTPSEIARIAGIVFRARDAALDFLRVRVAQGKPITGAEVDTAARALITAAGQGERFLHRTGHSLGAAVHGDGVNNDDFETHDARAHLPQTCFSIEPGVYLPGRFGVRSEADVCLVRDPAGGRVSVQVRGGEPQQSVPALLAP